MTIIYSKNYSFRKKWELFIQKIIQLQKNYSTKYSFKKFENYSFKKIIHFFEKLIIAQGYGDVKDVHDLLVMLQYFCLFIYKKTFIKYNTSDKNFQYGFPVT